MSTWPAVHGSAYEIDTLRLFEQPAVPLARAGRYAPRGRAVPLVGIVRNPRSHRNKGRDPELADCSNILIETPRTREALHACLAGFAERGIDFLVVDGGDGTVRDVLSTGEAIFGRIWPRLIILPKGKTNALTIDLGLPDHWSLAEALAAARGGRIAHRSPLRISGAAGQGGSAMGFFMGAGVFTRATDTAQAAHRHGAFRSFAVALAVIWVIVQSFFGRRGNIWRSCTPMRIVDRSTGQEVPHGDTGNPDERFIAVATTFEQFPLGAKPFGRNAGAGLKLGLIDYPVRRFLARLPAIIFGSSMEGWGGNAGHRLEGGPYTFDLGAAFILDGEAFPAGRYLVEEGPRLAFVVP
ncbi:diacylglycerol kinase family protein [Novosphingobium aquimarinum]|uniref:diacylglycerol kinase family protein n=1 Tax=Novosphingobium aquimarinum TaxID=2682494 RepID=UPI001E3E0BEE|nr:diacylglycerol kinase family protein [Novosphingobium aquimarinum]